MITCKRLASGLSLNSQPLIKSVLSLESGHAVEYASMGLGLRYGYRFIAAVPPSGNDVGITTFGDDNFGPLTAPKYLALVHG